MQIKNYCYNIKSNKDYCQIFSNNLILGWKTATITVIANTLTPFNIVLHPFLNRAIEVGIFHIIQTSYGPINPTNYYEISQNLNTRNAILTPIYQGVAQTNKYIPNIWGQNIIKNYFVNLDSILSPNPLTLIKGILTPLGGMTLFFITGEIEKAITDPMSKFYYTGTLFVGITTIAYQNCISTDSHIDKITGAVLLNFQDTFRVSSGLVLSFAILDTAIKTYELFENKIEEYKEIFTNNIKELSATKILTGTAFTIIATEFYLGETKAALLHSGTLISFSLAKAIAVTGVEIAKDYVDFSGLLTIEDFNNIYY